MLAVGILSSTSRLGERIETLLAREAAQSRGSRLFGGIFAAALVAFTLAATFTPRWIAFAQRPEFEVASIRPLMGPVRVSGGSFTPAARFR